MKITTFNNLVAEHEGKKDPTDIAQIAEITAVQNQLLNGVLYAIVGLMPEPRKNAKP